MSAPPRPNPRAALERVLNARDHAQALERMTALLGRAWEAGAYAGHRAADRFHADETDRTYDYTNPYAAVADTTP